MSGELERLMSLAKDDLQKELDALIGDVQRLKQGHATLALLEEYVAAKLERANLEQTLAEGMAKLRAALGEAPAAPPTPPAPPAPVEAPPSG